jgi:hypothetical protein
MDEPVKPKDPVTSDVAAGEECPSQSDRPYQRLDEEGKRRVCEAFKACLPDLKLPPVKASERPYPKLDAERPDRLARAVATTLPDLKLAKPRQPRETKDGETIH